MATQKELFALELLSVAQTATSEVMDKVADVDSLYFDNGYNSGGSDPIVDADLAAFNGLTAAQVGSVITAFQQLDNFFNNSAVTTGDYAVTFNAVRNAQM